MKSYFFYLICFIFLQFNIFANNQYQIIEDKSNLKVLNPSMKDRKTLKLRLSNGLKVYLVSDPKADKSAAAISVLAGSWDDPKAYPGMAHFCEHMLFKGSKKYPTESEYFKYIWDNNGNLNAFTAHDKTVYIFSINNKAFEEALDRLSHFFIDPLFDTSHIAKELYAVDQEHSKNIENDFRRQYMVSKEISNPNHPFSKFATGNSKTLGSIPPSELRKWYEKHYSSNLMALTIYSDLDLDKLTKLVVSKFSQVPNISKAPTTIKEKMFLETKNGKIVYLKPISNLQILSLEWELDPKFTDDPTKSAKLISYVLKRGQQNSLLENLKKEHLAEDLDISFEKSGYQNSTFSIAIKLTDSGVKNISEVIKRCFEAINNLKESNIPYYLFEEMQFMDKLNYEYQIQGDSYEFVTNHSFNLLDEDLSTYPKKTLLASNYNSQNILEILKELNYSNCQFFLIADPNKSNVSLESFEKWTKANYSIKDLNKKLLKTLSKEKTNPNIKIPKPNLFIPYDLTFTKASETLDMPKKIISNEYATIYYMQDDAKLPYISWNIKIKDKLLDSSLKSQILIDLYVKALNEKLTSTFFSANAAGLYPLISSDKTSIKINIFGFSSKSYLLLEEILKNIKNLEVSKDLFEIFQSSIDKDYENLKKQLPISQAQDYLSHILVKNTFTPDEKSNELKKITYKDFINFKTNIFSTCFLEGFLSGNMSIKEAESIWFDIKDTFDQKPFLKEQQIKKKIFEITNNSGPYFIEKTLPLLGNGIILAIDQDNFTFSNKASQNILSKALKEAFFTSLRSEQKTAYIAISSDLDIEKRLFQTFAVQSNSNDGQDLLSRFEIFIENYLDNITTNIPKDRFENIKQNILDSLKKPFNNLAEKSLFYNTLAFEKDEDFSWLSKRIESFEKLTYDQFLDFSKNTLSKNNKKRLAILFEGKINKDFRYKKLQDNDYEKIGSYK